MAERPRFMDDLAGVAGGAFSALAGIREEAESMIRARVDEAIRKLDLVRREDLDAVMEMAANARAGQEAAEARLAALEARLEGHLASMSGKAETGGCPRWRLPRWRCGGRRRAWRVRGGPCQPAASAAPARPRPRARLWTRLWARRHVGGCARHHAAAPRLRWGAWQRAVRRSGIA